MEIPIQLILTTVPNMLMHNLNTDDEFSIKVDRKLLFTLVSNNSVVLLVGFLFKSGLATINERLDNFNWQIVFYYT